MVKKHMGSLDILVSYHPSLVLPKNNRNMQMRFLKKKFKLFKKVTLWAQDGCILVGYYVYGFIRVLEQIQWIFSYKATTICKWDFGHFGQNNKLDKRLWIFIANAIYDCITHGIPRYNIICHHSSFHRKTTTICKWDFNLFSWNCLENHFMASACMLKIY